MGSETPTGKVIARKGEPSEKIAKFDFVSLLKLGKESPLLVLAIAVASWLGGQPIIDAAGQTIPSFWVGVGVLVFAIFQRIARFVTETRQDIKEIKGSLRDGADTMRELRGDVDVVKAEISEVKAEVSHIKKMRPNSAGNLKPGIA